MRELDPYFVWGCNFSIRKEALLKAGGFHPDGMPQNLIRYRGDGESSVSQHIKKSGYRTIFNPKASVHHVVSAKRMTLEYFQRRAFNQGISDSYTMIRKTKQADVAKPFLSRLKGIRRRLQDCALDLQTAWRMKMGVSRAMFLRSFKIAVRDSYQKGYQFHQEAAALDPLLMEWITREHYRGVNALLPTGAAERSEAMETGISENRQTPPEGQEEN